jgi:hypothetical protein
MSNETLQQLDASIKTAKGFVESGNALERLQSNRDFKKVVVEGYFEKEAIRLVHLKADPMMQTPERQASIDAQINAIGMFSQHLVNVGQFARQAAKSIADDEQTRADVLAEGGE